MIFPSIFVIWLTAIGFSSYCELVSISGNKINPFKIKGYSVRLAYDHSRKDILGIFDHDVYLLKLAAQDNERLWRIFSANYAYSVYSDNDFLRALLNDTHFNDNQKLYLYLIVGLNTGDFTEGYNLLNLNERAAQKVPLRYRHYFYEGVAVSLMNRRHKELLENIDFINTVPVKYRHYFWYETGRGMGTHFRDKIREEKMRDLPKGSSSLYRDYLYQGLICGLIIGKSFKTLQKDKDEIKQEYLPYFYRTSARNFFSALPTQEEISARIMQIGIDKKGEKYFYYGVVESFFQDLNNYSDEEIKKRIREVVNMRVNEKGFIYEGLGLMLGHLTFGHINRFPGVIETSLDSGQLGHFYYGYCISLKERYGFDLDMMKWLIDDNVNEGFKEMCYSFVHNPGTK